MKKILLVFVALVCCMSMRAQIVQLMKGDKVVATYNSSEVDKVVFKEEKVESKQCPDGNHPHAIDLGLPSGIKWACCNVGAATPEAYGEYFSWGETEQKDDYDWDRLYNKYDKQSVLELKDDAAHVNWGGNWRMPTIAELDELRNNCIWTWTKQDDVNGYIVSSMTSDNYIFLPAAGNRYQGSLYEPNLTGTYWSSSLASDQFYARCLYFSLLNSGVKLLDTARTYCNSVRAVCQ